MSSACTCHINPEYCWWCLYEREKAENARLREALEFYANEDNYRQSSADYEVGYPPEVANDGGYRARQALKE